MNIRRRNDGPKVNGSARCTARKRRMMQPGAWQCGQYRGGRGKYGEESGRSSK